MINIQSTTPIKSYNEMVYSSRLVKFSDFMSNKNNIVHKKLYNMAIDKYIKEWLIVKQSILEIDFISHKLKNENITEEQEKLLNEKLEDLKQFVIYHKDDKKYIEGKHIYNVNSLKEFKDNCFMYEIMNDEYWKPSLCKIITKIKNKNNPNMSWTVDLTPYWNMYQDNKNKTFRNLKLSNNDFNDAKITDINYVNGKVKLYSENINKEFEVDFDEINGQDIHIDDDLSLKTSFDYLR